MLEGLTVLLAKRRERQLPRTRPRNIGQWLGAHARIEQRVALAAVVQQLLRQRLAETALAGLSRVAQDAESRRSVDRGLVIAYSRLGDLDFLLGSSGSAVSRESH